MLSSAGSMPSAVKLSSHSVARKSRGMSQRSASSSEIPRRSRSSGSIVSSNSALRVGEDGAALVGEVVELEAEAAVELDGVGRAEILDRLERDGHPLAVHGVQVLLGELVPRLLERPPLVAVGLVRHRRAQHAEADGVAVHGRLELRLERGDLLGMLLREVPEVLGTAEVPQLADRAIAVR